jgi:hypothetical protein
MHVSLTASVRILNPLPNEGVPLFIYDLVQVSVNSLRVSSRVSSLAFRRCRTIELVLLSDCSKQ